jgi:hypothetical protein
MSWTFLPLHSQKNSTNTMDLYKTRLLLLTLESKFFVLDMIQMGSSWTKISWEFIDSVILMISCRVNDPNLRPNIQRDTDTKKQEQGFNVAFEIWLMNSIKKKKKWACKNYSTILLSKFEAQNMISKSQRKINSKTARNIFLWSHFRIRARFTGDWLMELGIFYWKIWV